MAGEPPTKWKLYRFSVLIDEVHYLIPPRWCVLAPDAGRSVDNAERLVVVGPRVDEKISAASAIEGKIILKIAPGPRSCAPKPAGTVWLTWMWNDTKGLLTNEEIQAGERGLGHAYV